MNIVKLREGLPCWSSVPARIVVSRLPTGNRHWQVLGVFRHHCLGDADYAIGVFAMHVSRANLAGDPTGKAILDLGPGDSVASAVIATGHGARASLVDSGRFTKESLGVYPT